MSNAEDRTLAEIVRIVETRVAEIEAAHSHLLLRLLLLLSNKHPTIEDWAIPRLLDEAIRGAQREDGSETNASGIIRGLQRDFEMARRPPHSAAASAPGEARGSMMADQPSFPLRVLIASDNAEEAEASEALFSAWGHVTRIARSSAEVLELAETFVPEVAFIDLAMPTMDGFELARRLRAMPSWLPVSLLAISGYGRKEEKGRAHQAGFDHLLTKPVSTDLLADALAVVAQRSISRRVHRVPARSRDRDASG